jgi:hypothetical protein
MNKNRNKSLLFLLSSLLLPDANISFKNTSKGEIVDIFIQLQMKDDF